MSRLGSGDTADHIIESGVSAAEWSMPTYRANADMITRSSTPPFVRPLLAAIASLSETSKISFAPVRCASNSPQIFHAKNEVIRPSVASPTTSSLLPSERAISQH